ncbi:MAG: type II secretion system F family protein [Phycisphaerae bacterium]|nr:type II secretion system F family protein [Phycisphaerae bacterium]
MVLFIFLAFTKPGLALFASLPASLVYLTILGQMDTYEYGNLSFQIAFVIAALIFPITLIIVTVRGIRTDLTERRWPHFLAFWIWRILYYLSLLVILSFVMNVVGTVIWFMYMVFEHRIFVANRQSIALDVVSTIGSCVRQNLPLPMAMETAAAGYSGKRKRIFLGIARWLTEGYPLSAAIRIAYPNCPSHITSTIEAAEKVNQLPEAVRSIEADIESNVSETGKVRPVTPGYPVVIFSVTIVIMLGLMIFIIPTFADVLDDMSEGAATLPRATQILIGIADFTLSGNGVIAVLIVLTLLLLNIGVPWIRAVYRKMPRKTNNPALIIRVGDFIKWRLPILHWFEFNYSIMRVAGFLRVSLNSGCPVNDSIKNAEDLDLNNCFRKRLSRWLTRVEQGQNVSAAALDTGMGNSLAWAFDDKVNAGNTPEILGMLEKFYRSNFNFKANVVRAICFPITILLLSSVVGFIAYAMFMPIVTIITFLTETALP